jgi:hypothetical protein
MLCKGCERRPGGAYSTAVVSGEYEAGRKEGKGREGKRREEKGRKEGKEGKDT